MGFKDKLKAIKVPKKEKKVVDEKPQPDPDIPLNKQREFRA